MLSRNEQRTAQPAPTTKTVVTHYSSNGEQDYGTKDRHLPFMRRTIRPSSSSTRLQLLPRLRRLPRSTNPIKLVRCTYRAQARRDTCHKQSRPQGSQQVCAVSAPTEHRRRTMNMMIEVKGSDTLPQTETVTPSVPQSNAPTLASCDARRSQHLELGWTQERQACLCRCHYAKPCRYWCSKREQKATRQLRHTQSDTDTRHRCSRHARKHDNAMVELWVASATHRSILQVQSSYVRDAE